MTTEARKYLFDLSFDRKMEELQKIEAPPPPPVFSEEQLAEAEQVAHEKGKEEGFATGHEAGVQEASDKIRGEYDSMFAEHLPVFRTHLLELLSHEQERWRSVSHESLNCIRMILQKLFPALVKKHGMVDIDRLLEEAFLSLQNETKLVIYVHPNLVETLQERAMNLAGMAEYEGRIVTKPDPALQYGECRMEWSDGGAEHLLQKKWKEIEDGLNELLELTKVEGMGGEDGSTLQQKEKNASENSDQEVLGEKVDS